MMRRLTAALLVIVLVLMSLGGCSQDGTVMSPENTSPPVLPPASTMAMSLSMFESAQVNLEALVANGYETQPLESGLESKLNFINAALRVHFLNLVVCVALVEPVAAFALAGRSIPQPQSDGSWLWTYIFVSEDAEYSIFLNGKNMGSYTAWRMEVSSTDPSIPFDHFLWFEGEVQSHENSGYWQFYEPEEEPVALSAGAGEAFSTPGVESIRIDWMNTADDEHELVFLVNKPGAPEEGSYLTYLEIPTMSSVEFHDSKTGNDGIITWYPDGSGSIQWPDYKDGEQYCWDTLQFNAECP
ncbi:MAG: hypothetical protein ABIJ00_01975 [Candidatus Eisenbacteria bacterium]